MNEGLGKGNAVVETFKVSFEFLSLLRQSLDLDEGPLLEFSNERVPSFPDLLFKFLKQPVDLFSLLHGRLGDLGFHLVQKRERHLNVLSALSGVVDEPLQL